MNGSGQGERNKATGAVGEELAASYLRERGYVILERNFRCKGGEVDIVARDGATLVFVEVKARRSMVYGVPQLAVTPFKQRQIARAAQYWLAKNHKVGSAARFDVLAILLPAGAAAVVEHIPNAFDLPY
jgi:putative endonuclease